MSWYPKFRDVHLWIGLILMIPILLIAATGIGLNHEHALGLKGMEKAEHGGRSKMKTRKNGNGEKSSSTTPAEMASTDAENSRAEPAAERKTPKAKSESNVTATFESSAAPWSQHAASIEQAVAVAREVWGQDVPLDRIELKNERSVGMVVKVKASEKANVEPDEIVWAIADETRMLRPEDRPHASGMAGINWAKVVKDLHTGKLFSKNFGYWWSDITAGALLLLSGTGLVLYVIPILKKAAKKKRVPPGAAVAAPRKLPAVLAAKKAPVETETAAV